MNCIFSVIWTFNTSCFCNFLLLFFFSDSRSLLLLYAMPSDLQLYALWISIYLWKNPLPRMTTPIWMCIYSLSPECVTIPYPPLYGPSSSRIFLSNFSRSNMLFCNHFFQNLLHSSSATWPQPFLKNSPLLVCHVASNFVFFLSFFFILFLNLFLKKINWILFYSLTSSILININ